MLRPTPVRPGSAAHRGAAAETTSPPGPGRQGAVPQQAARPGPEAHQRASPPPVQSCLPEAGRRVGWPVWPAPALPRRSGPPAARFPGQNPVLQQEAPPPKRRQAAVQCLERPILARLRASTTTWHSSRKDFSIRERVRARRPRTTPDRNRCAGSRAEHGPAFFAPGCHRWRDLKVNSPDRREHARAPDGVHPRHRTAANPRPARRTRS